MSRLTSVSDQLETWRGIVSSAQPITSPAESNQQSTGETNGENLSPSPEPSLPSSNTLQLTMSEFISQSCPEECGCLVNRILKKVLPALRQSPSSYPLCSADMSLPEQKEEILRPLELGPQSQSVTKNSRCSYPVPPSPRRMNLSTPNGLHPPSQTHQSPKINLHPSIPDFILEATAHHILHSFAIFSILEDEERDHSIPLTKEHCELVVRSLAVASIYVAGKVAESIFLSELY